MYNPGSSRSPTGCHERASYNGNTLASQACDANRKVYESPVRRLILTNLDSLYPPARVGSLSVNAEQVIVLLSIRACDRPLETTE